MARKARINVYGPYKRGNRWRVVIKSGTVQQPHSFPSEAEAVRFRDETRREVEGRTVSEALDAYVEHLRRMDRAPATLATVRAAITRLVPDVQLASVGAGTARSMYLAITGDYAAATHQNSLAAVVAFWDWMARQGWVGDRNPWEDVEPIGTANRGKQQLTLDEARRFVEVCYAEAERRAGPVAVLLAFLLAMRAGEIVALRGRDVDDGGRLIRIVRGKTRKATRALEVPDRLRPLVAELAAFVGPTGLLFPFSRHNVGSWTRVLADKAGVAKVCPHGLRGTHSSLAAEAGATAHLVAAALGHASPAVTRAHYLAPGAEDRATAGRLSGLLGNGNQPSRFPSSTDDAN